MLEANPITTPMVSSLKLSKFGPDSLTDALLYRSIVGGLQYATLTRPEIAYSVNKVCQFMSHPLETHWKAVKRILRYLKGTLSYGLELKPAPSLEFSIWLHIVMQIGGVMWMIEDQLPGTAYSLVPILFPGVQRNKHLLLGPLLKLSIEVWLMLLQSCYGFSLFYMN